jgi:putative tryptophan/tyrosine transport system substrate-binding protein
MKRREFITVLGGAASWPAAARGQQSAVPLVGWLSARSPDVEGPLVAAFRRGLAEIGYVEGRNVAIESHWAYGQTDRLPGLAADLLRRQVSVMVSLASGRPGIEAIRGANPTIPIVFTTGGDPVQTGMVESLSRPTGNITGVSSLQVEVGPKLIELLHELAPQATNIALLANAAAGDPFPPPDMLAAAQSLGLTLHPLRASNEGAIDEAFAALPKLGADGLVVQIAPLFTSRMDQLAALALRHRVPTVYQLREFAVRGGLASYGGDLTESTRVAALYVGRILKGEKPADLPVQRVTKIELIINLKTAKSLGLTIPESFLLRADEVIE